MHRSSTPDVDRLSVAVETALKALGIASGESSRSDRDLRGVVEDLRRSEEMQSSPRPVQRARDIAVAPSLLASDDDVIDL